MSGDRFWVELFLFLTAPARAYVWFIGAICGKRLKRTFLDRYMTVTSAPQSSLLFHPGEYADPS